MLEQEYENESDIPSGYRALYVEKDGKFVLRPGGDIRTVDDVTKVQSANKVARQERDEANRELARFKELGELEDVQIKLDSIPELEAKAEGSVDEEKLNELAEKKATAMNAPVLRKLEKAEKDLAERDTRIGEYEAADRTRAINDAMNQAAIDQKLHAGGIEDALMYGQQVLTIDETTGEVVTKDNVGVTPGISPAVLLTEIKEKRAHWWPESVGGGSTGGSGGAFGDNPYKGDTPNLTKIGQLMNSDPKKAEQMAKAAGKDPLTGMPLQKAS